MFTLGLGGAGAYMNYGQTSAAYGQQYMNYYPTYSVPMASTPTVASSITSNATAISTATATASTPTSAPGTFQSQLNFCIVNESMSVYETS